MRKSYLLIAAVATAFLASCSNERVLNKFEDDSQLAPITFTSYSEKATKGDPDNPDFGDKSDPKNLEYYHKTFAVHGTKKDIYDGEIQYVFGNPNTLKGTTCSYTGDSTINSFYGTNWEYDEERYWDKRAKYNFIAYAPALQDTNLLHFTYGQATEVGPFGVDGRDVIMENYYMRATNLQQPQPQEERYDNCFNYENGKIIMGTNNIDIDMMVADPWLDISGSSQQTIKFVFHHIFSKIDISVAKVKTMNESVVIVDSITITGLRDKGSYFESLRGKDTTMLGSGWILAAANHDPNYQIVYKHADNHRELPKAKGDTIQQLCFVESLLLPQVVSDDAILSIKYHFYKEGGEYTETYKYEGKLNDLFATIQPSSHYSILLTLDSKAIGFDVTTSGWVPKEENTVNLDDIWKQQ